ncbi:hypothetical protein Q9L58_000382 [Maublancomyces gigas]|uniref:Uncharacterized protein n=1 Tax=Discina gigas TaxID=1032678 RepID=A0ABR3GWS6_9PEZI
MPERQQKTNKDAKDTREFEAATEGPGQKDTVGLRMLDGGMTVRDMQDTSEASIIRRFISLHLPYKRHEQQERTFAPNPEQYEQQESTSAPNPQYYGQQERTSAPNPEQYEQQESTFAPNPEQYEQQGELYYPKWKSPSPELDQFSNQELYEDSDGFLWLV